MNKYIIVLASSIFALGACKKEEGKGGKLSIKGTVVAKYYDKNYTVYTGSLPAADEDVYLVYGDQPGYGERTRTDYKGEFAFQYLKKGDYKVYLYSKDTTQSTPSGEITIANSVDLTRDKDLGTIYIAKKDERKLDKGPYSITGTVAAKFCNSTYTYCSEPFGTPEIDVYIMKLGEQMYFERVRTADAGIYAFQELPSGKYVVYTVSENTLSAADETQAPYVTMKDTVTVGTANIANVNFVIVQ